MCLTAEVVKAKLDRDRAAIVETFDGKRYWLFDRDFNEWAFSRSATIVPGFRADGPHAMRGERSDIALHDARLVA